MTLRYASKLELKFKVNWLISLAVRKKGYIVTMVLVFFKMYQDLKQKEKRKLSLKYLKAIVYL